jgi:hypothetical protein
LKLFLLSLRTCIEGLLIWKIIFIPFTIARTAASISPLWTHRECTVCIYVRRGKIIFINRTGFILPAFMAAHIITLDECRHPSLSILPAHTRAKIPEIYIK